MCYTVAIRFNTQLSVSHQFIRAHIHTLPHSLFRSRTLSLSLALALSCSLSRSLSLPHILSVSSFQVDVSDFVAMACDELEKMKIAANPDSQKSY